LVGYHGNSTLANALPVRIDTPVSVEATGSGSIDSIGFTSLSMY
jgi:hypothetical protein